MCQRRCREAVHNRQAYARAHYRRYSEYDYSRGASVFVTIGTLERIPCFGTVQNAKMYLSHFGEIAETELVNAARVIDGVSMRMHIVMPDHVHARFTLQPGLPEPMRTAGAFVGRFKQLTQWRIQQAGGPYPLWEAGYHDLLSLSQKMNDAIDLYIRNNPMKWWIMHGDRSLLHVREPLDYFWLPHTQLWRGVGEFTPVPGQRLVALRVSRRLNQSEVNRVVAQCLQGAFQGDVFLSTFFSPGERAVYRAVATQTITPLLHLRGSEINWGYRPTGLETQLFAAHRLMVMAPMSATDAEASRKDLLQLNEMARQIALFNGGLALYFQPGF